MGNNATQIMFPLHAVQFLQGMRGDLWDDLLMSLKDLSPLSCEVSGFILMMTRQCGCSTCNSDSFRAMKGCIECSRQAIKRYKGDDDSLMAIHHKCISEMEKKQHEKNYYRK